MNFGEKAEEELQFKRKDNATSANLIFLTHGSSGKNPEKLAQLLTAYDLIINILGWKDKPIASLTNITTQYQASIEGGYHKDFKEVLIAEEIERRKADRKGLSISNP